MVKIKRHQAIERIQTSMQILEDLQRYLLEEEAHEDRDEGYMQGVLDSLSDIANQRAEHKDKTPLLCVSLRQPEVTMTILFDVTVNFHDVIEE